MHLLFITPLCTLHTSQPITLTQRAQVFHDDIRGFRNYCLQDTQQYGRLVELLDEQDGGGWELLSDMLRGDKSALQLTQHRFLVPKSKQGQGGGGKGGLGGFTLPWQSKQ